MTEKWWVDPSYDPMQDLHDCKKIISEMAPAMREHAQVIRELTHQHTAMLELIKEHRLEIALLSAEVKTQRDKLQILESSPIIKALCVDSVK